MLCSKENINQLLRIWAAKNVIDDTGTEPIYSTYDAMLQQIDDIPWGSAPWYTFKVRWNGPVAPSSPAWKRTEYLVHAQNPLQVSEIMLGTPDFKGKFHQAAFREFAASGGPCYSDYMSGEWAWKESVRDFYRL